MKKINKVLLIGPFPEPTTGVSLANEVVKSILDEQDSYTVSHINTSYNRFDENVGSFTLHKLLFNLKFYFNFWKIFGCDILYITPGQSFFGVLKYSGFIILGALSRKQIITHIHGNHLATAYKKLSGVKKWFFKSLVAKTTKGIVLSESLRSNMEEFIGKEQTFILPNFAEDYLHKNSPEKSYKQLKVVYLSNLMKEKGIFDLIAALKKLEKSNIPYSAKIAGSIDQEHKEVIFQEIKQLKHTVYLGIVKGDSKKELLQWGTTFVLPTYYTMEGQPISILEALATGNGIITTRHAGIPDVIKDGVHGSYVSKKNPQEIYKKLSELAINPEKMEQIGKSNTIFFKANFTKDIFKSRLLEIFKIR